MAKRGHYGTPMTIEKVKRKGKKRRRNDYTHASQVTITRADGSVEVKNPYPRGAHARIVGKRRK